MEGQKVLIGVGWMDGAIHFLYAESRFTDPVTWKQKGDYGGGRGVSEQPRRRDGDGNGRMATARCNNLMCENAVTIFCMLTKI